jgi:UDP-N-acetylmuramoyl-L-alanyl-D-glutamate--2,6-diaminopimelate ligase
LVTFECQGQTRQLKLKLQGEFNAYNALAATAVTSGMGIDFAVIKKALESLERIPGRMDAVDAGQDFKLFVDYAHTPDAIENILRATRALTIGKLVCISGAAGERSISRRAPVAKIASQLSDVFIITDDEPFSEDPTKIRNQVKTGIQTGKGMAQIIEVADRTEAIKKAVSLVKKGDTIVIAGMGHQKYRSGPAGKEKWDDFAVATAVLQGKEDSLTKNWQVVMHQHYPDSY